MGNISITSLQKRKDHIVLGDVCYFATPQYSLNNFHNCISLLKNKEITPLCSGWLKAGTDLRKDHIPYLLFTLMTEYRNFREIQNDEPIWIERLPWKLKRFLRQDFLCTDPRLDAYLFPKLPYSGFGYHVLAGGLTDRVCRAFGLHRLDGVKQLGFLHQTIDIKEVGHVTTLGFNHTRFNHVLDVRAVAKLILENNGATLHEHLLSDIACLSHDARTPAGSDSVKGIDFKAFDEDVHYPKVLAKADFTLLPEISEHDKQKLIQIILNRGKLGSVLDVADKIAYISRDTFHFLAPHQSENGENVEWKIIEETRRMTSVWETVRIDGDKVFFTDQDRLIAFLEHRAMMFRELYQNPNSRFWEQFVQTFVLERFYKTGRISEERLLTMQDWELKSFIHQEIGENILDRLLGTMDEKREGFNTLVEARARKAELRRKGRMVCIIEKSFPVKIGAHFLVQTKSGLMTLKKSAPKVAEHIHSLAQAQWPFNLYYIDIPRRQLPKSLRSWKY